METKECSTEDDQASSAQALRAANVKRARLFHDMPEPLIQHVAMHASERRLQGGDVLFLKNDPQDFIAIVVAGCIHTIVHGPDGRELIVDSFAAGDVVGETALIDNKRRDTAALACGSTRVLILRRHHFAILMAEPTFLNRLLTLLSSRLRDAATLVESLSLHRLESRLARYFLSAVDECGREVPDGIVIPMPPSQSLLASMVNASRPKLNAQLQAWRRSGLVSWTQDSLLITDVDQLRSMAYAAAS